MADDGSLLTPTQREFLGGETDVTWDDSRGRTLRTRLRKRLVAGIQDFASLADPELFDDRDLELVRERLRDEQVFESGLAEMVAFVYRLAPDAFESIVETGVNRGVDRCTPAYEVEDVSISIHKRGQVLEQAREKMEQNDALTDREIRIMLQAGDMSAEDLQTYV